MKKTVLATGGFIALGVLCYVGSLWGQQNPPAGGQAPAAAPVQPARTRIALLNLTYVIKNYEKYKHFQDEIKGIIDPFQKKDAELRQAMESLRKKAGEVANQPQSAQRDELERQGKELQRKLEDNSAEAKLILGKRSDEEMKILFMDVYEAAQRYATSHDFELVLHYNDAVTPEDFMSAQNIARKLNTGALMPFYWMRSMDISVDVVNMLNYNMRSATTPTGGTAPAAPTGGDGR